MLEEKFKKVVVRQIEKALYEAKNINSCYTVDELLVELQDLVDLLCEVVSVDIKK